MGDSTDDVLRVVAGRYRLMGKIGQGGMGTVWKAHDDLLGRTVAIKEVDLRQLTSVERPRMRERTLREARTAARLSHPNAVTVFDVVEEDGQPWIVMSLVVADSLADVIAERGPLAPERVAEVGLALLSALEAAHRAGILHRDVKPSNVLIGDDGTVVLTDFGIATLEGDVSLTSTGMLFGAPAYIAPERARGQRPGPASDLWSLGATLYTAVEGNPPFDRESPMATLTALVSEDLPVPRSAGRLTPALKALLERDPAHRVDAAGARLLLEQARPGHRPDPAPGAPTTAVPPDQMATRTLPVFPEEAAGWPPGTATPSGPATVRPEPPARSPEPAASPVPPPDAYRTPPGRRSRPSVVLLALLAALLVGAAGTAVVLAHGGEKGTPAAKAPGSPQPSPARSSPATRPTPSAGASQPRASAGDFPTLSQGSSGPRVRAAQYLLRHGGRVIDIDGNYGAAMAQEVRDYQSGKGLAVSGHVDPATWAALVTTVRRGDNSDAVSAAQTLLVAAGHDLTVDGLFGAKTESAVRDFRAGRGLAVSGVVTPDVFLDLLNRA